MSRARGIGYSAACLFVIWNAAALAETNAEPAAKASAEPSSAVANADPRALETRTDGDTSSATSDIVGAISITPAKAEACPAADIPCIDQYLWSLYERTPKIDALKITERKKVTVTRKGKSRTVTKTVVRYVDEDFAWKDFKAAEKFGLPPMEYVIGGMDRTFKRTLYHALRTMDDAGLMPGITSAFRDDYRQTIASGNKARADRSFHGGSTRGGYGHGMAVDLVSVKGANRAERYRSSEELWKWIDANGRPLGVGRPYGDRDAPHVSPIGGREFAMKAGRAKTRLAAKAKGNYRLASQETGRESDKAAGKATGKEPRKESRRARRASAAAPAKSDKGQIRTHRATESSKGRARKSAT
jgi:hypothetical protein